MRLQTSRDVWNETADLRKLKKRREHVIQTGVPFETTQTESQAAAAAAAAAADRARLVYRN